MNVKELIEQLSQLNPEAEVILQQDPEGNGYHLARGAEECVYNKAERDVLSLSWTAADACMSEEEWAEVLARPRSVVVYP